MQILTLVFLLASALCCHAADTLSRLKASHFIEFNIRPSYVMPTHPLYKGYNESGKAIRFSGSAHLQYAFCFSPDSNFGELFPTAYQGIGVGGQSFFRHSEIGTPLALYIFQGADIARLAPNLSLGYEWNFGLSFGWHENSAVRSALNAYINAGLLMSWQITPYLTLTAGPEYTHFSNGDTTFPNAGANTVGMRLGVRGNIHGEGVRKSQNRKNDEYEKELCSKPFKERIAYDLTIFGAWRAARDIVDRSLYIINKPFPIAGLNFNPLYRIDRHFSVGAALDFNYDGSANLYGHVVDKDTKTVSSYLTPSFREQISAGASVRGELTMPIFSVNIGAGCNFYMKGEDMKRFYTIFNLKAFLTDRLFLLIGYRLSSLQYTHNLMFGIGWRL